VRVKLVLRIKDEDLEVEPKIWTKTIICIYTKIHDIDNQYQAPVKRRSEIELGTVCLILGKG